MSTITLRNKLKVFAVAIDEYPTCGHELYGCVNDCNALIAHLKNSYDSNQSKLDIKTLHNKAATRENITNTFLDFYSDLKDGDIAIFYYSGHGSQMTAPDDIWCNDGDGKLETIVCYDSRQENGLDLLDQEISYLIWKVTQNKKVNFNLIMDCCHSGSINRGVDKHHNMAMPAERVRKVADAKKPTKHKFLGIESYTETDGKLQAPVRPHILLAACDEYEYAKERFIAGRMRGVFTYSLITVLEKSNNRISLAALHNQIQIFVKNNTIDQHPKFKPVGQEHVNQLFLGGFTKEGSSTHLLYYSNTKGWMINCGAIHGIEKRNVEDQIVLSVYEPDAPEQQIGSLENTIAEVFLDEVFASTSSININDTNLDNNKVYKAVFNDAPIPKMKFAFSNESDNHCFDINDDEWKSPYFDLVGNPKNASFILTHNNNAITISSEESPIPYQRKLENWGLSSLRTIKKDMEHIARWFQSLQLGKQVSSISKDDYKMTFYEVLKTSNDYLEVLEEEQRADFQNNNFTLRYAQFSEEDKKLDRATPPMFRLKVENTSKDKRLWFSLLYFGMDFNVDNQLLPGVQLAPGQEKFIGIYLKQAQVYCTLIPLCIKKDFQEASYDTILERFKLIVSMAEVDTGKLNQEGLFGAIKKRDIGGLDLDEDLILCQDDWTVADFSVYVATTQRHAVGQ